MEIPRIISVDDHVVEPPDLWTARLPARWADRAPRVERHKVKMNLLGGYNFEVGVEDGVECDVWYYDDLVYPFTRLSAAVGAEVVKNEPCTFDQILPGCYDQTARLADMDANHVDASICFPNILPRLCGQAFYEREDKELALACIQVYNDWMIDEWCGGAGKGRLVPLTLVPLWDPQLAAEEVRRCNAKGSFAIAFSENPSKLGVPSMYSGEWDVLWAACQESDTSVSMHIGSSSSMPTTSEDAPLATSMSLYAQNAQGSLADWVFSGTLQRFPGLTIAYAESQVGWMPFQLERMDAVWNDGRGGTDHVTVAPSEQVRGRVYGCVFDDLYGLKNRELVGTDHILFETDYPHADGTFPHSRKIAHELFVAAGMDADDCYKVLRGNAIEAYGLHRFGITS